MSGTSESWWQEGVVYQVYIRSFAGTPHHLAQALLVASVHRRQADLSVPHDACSDDGVVDQRRLVDDRRCEACDTRALGVDEDLRLVALSRGQRLLGDLQGTAHEETPTSTPRNRAGDAPCDTCAS